MILKAGLKYPKDINFENIFISKKLNPFKSPVSFAF